MWNKAPEKLKCPRGDCEYHDRKADELPCRACTCNRECNSMCRAFRYTSKAMQGFNSDKKKGDQS